jgi:hypothetical protein
MTDREKIDALTEIVSMARQRSRWVRVPVSTPMTPFTVREHTPVYAHKEYPRYINKPGWQEPAWEWRLIE